MIPQVEITVNISRFIDGNKPFLREQIVNILIAQLNPLIPIGKLCTEAENRLRNSDKRRKCVRGLLFDVSVDTYFRIFTYDLEMLLHQKILVIKTKNIAMKMKLVNEMF